MTANDPGCAYNDNCFIAIQIIRSMYNAGTMEQPLDGGVASICPETVAGRGGKKADSAKTRQYATNSESIL